MKLKLKFKVEQNLKVLHRILPFQAKFRSNFNSRFEMKVIKGSQRKLKEISFILLENQFGNHYKNNDFKTDEHKHV